MRTSDGAAAALSPSPSSRRAAVNSPRARPGHAGERLYALEQRRRAERAIAAREAREAAQRRRAEEERRVALCSPQKLSREDVRRFYDAQRRWRAEADAVARDQWRDRQRQRYAAYTAPALSPRSQQMLAEGGYRGPVEGWDERVARYEQTRSSARRQLTDGGASAAAAEAGSSGAVSPRRIREIVDRQYSEALESRRRSLQGLMQALDEEAAGGKGRVLFHPQTTPYRRRGDDAGGDADHPTASDANEVGVDATQGSSPEGRAATPASSRLYELARTQQRQRAAALAERQAEERRSNTFTPQINDVSRAMQLPKRQPLYVPPQSTSQPVTPRRGEQNGDAAPPAAEEAAAAAAVIVSPRRLSRNDLAGFYARNERLQRMRRVRRREAYYSALEEDLAACTFRPALTPRTRELARADAAKTEAAVAAFRRGQASPSLLPRSLNDSSIPRVAGRSPPSMPAAGLGAFARLKAQASRHEDVDVTGDELTVDSNATTFVGTVSVPRGYFSVLHSPAPVPPPSTTEDHRAVTPQPLSLVRDVSAFQAEMRSILDSLHEVT